MVVYECFFLANATVEQYYLILWMISTFFSFASNCVGYFVFYNLIHGLLGRLTDAGNPYRPIAIMHWIVVGIVSAFSLACWGMYVAVQDFSVMSPNFHFFGVYRYVQSALEIVYWLVSIEVLAWTIFIAVKAGSYRFNTKVSSRPYTSKSIRSNTSQTPAIALIFASIFWLGNNLEWAVIQILYIIKGNFTPVYLGLVVSVTQFLFVIGIFVGILVCCNSWSRLDDAYEKPAAMMQQPYGTAPSNGQYQVYQPYQAQAPQMLQPYPQQPQEQH